MSFSDNIKKFMKQNDLTAQKVADFVGVTRSAVTNWSNGIRFPTDSETIKALARCFRVSVGDLFADEDDEPTYEIPITGEASCGSAIVSSFQDVGRTCRYKGKYHRDLYCVIASGDSMAPDIEDGDEIIIDPRATPMHGDVVLYTIDGESAIKVYTFDKEANIVQFVPYNPSPDFKVRTVRLDDCEASNMTIHPVIRGSESRFNNRTARLRLIGRA